MQECCENMEQYAHRFEKAFEQARRTIKTEIQKRMSEIHLHLTGPQFFVLYLISEKGSIKLTRLAEIMDVKPSAVTVMIDRLENCGYVKRHHDEEDRRAILVKLTDQGKDVLQKVASIRRDVVGKWFSCLKPEELESFLRTYEKLAQYIPKEEE